MNLRIWIVAVVAIVVGVVIGAVLYWWVYSRIDESFVPYRYNDPAEVTEALGNSGAAGPGRGQREPRPHIEVVNGAVHDFGIVDSLQYQHHEFVLANRGDAPLVVTLADVTCKCTSADLARGDSVTIAPGDQYVVGLQWVATRGARQFEEMAVLRTNDPDPMRRRIDLRIRGQVRSALEAIPDRITWSNLSVTESRGERIQVLSYRQPEFEIVGARVTPETLAPFFEIEWEPLAADDETLAGEAAPLAGYVAHIESRPGMPLGAFHVEVELQTDLQDYAPVSVQIRGQAVGDVQLHAGTGEFRFRPELNLLELGLVPAGRSVETQLNVVVRGEHAMETEVSVQLENVDPAGVLSAELGEPIDQQRVRVIPLTIRVTPTDRAVDRLGPAQDTYGQVIIETTHPHARQVVLRVAFATPGR